MKVPDGGGRATARTLVIGYGNSLRGDDGAGPLVASQIGAGAIACQQLTPELAEPMSRAGRVIFVDAHADLPAGQIRVERIRPRLSQAIHRFDPETLLAWSQQLYGRAPEALLVGIGAGSFDLGETLSPQARRAARKALRAVRKLSESAWSSGTRDHIALGNALRVNAGANLGDTGDCARQV
ncbi:MAG TPA: hydrogenase maturation protease [Bryobacteraceae bacterium]|nr:hydrogenase maturation protease [Bryobacteraceae bacterium]